VQPLLVGGHFLDEFRERCVDAEPRDVLALVVRLRWPGRSEDVVLVDRYDPESRLTAMARTTALTTAVVAQLAATGGVREAGVLPLDRVARDERAFRFIVDGLARRGVRLRWSSGSRRA
jgi:saccharopine dehydrogenase-like NADP-dependent oxidoreductase